MNKRKKIRTNQQALIDMFRRDPELAVDVLNEVLADGDDAEVNVAIRLVATALGGVPAVARKARLNPTQLYRTLSENGNPEFRNLRRVLGAVGLRFAVTTRGSSSKSKPVSRYQ